MPAAAVDSPSNPQVGPLSRRTKSTGNTAPGGNPLQRRQIIGKYELGAVLAAGDFDCRTRLCTHTVTGVTYVVRIYSKQILAEAQWMWERLRESIRVQRTLPKHENIVQMLECFETESSLFILMHLFPSVNITNMFIEGQQQAGSPIASNSDNAPPGLGAGMAVLGNSSMYVGSGSLPKSLSGRQDGSGSPRLGSPRNSPFEKGLDNEAQHWRSWGGLTDGSSQGTRGAVSITRVRDLFLQIVNGVLHLHRHSVVHTGIAPDHILVHQERGNVKISNLVSCCFCTRGQKFHCLRGTRHTVAPELLRQEPYDPYLADAWSVGIVLYFMLHGGRYPHDGANTLQRILYHHIRPCNPGLPPNAQDLVKRLLQPNPGERLSLEAVLFHSFCTNVSDRDHGFVVYRSPTISPPLRTTIFQGSFTMRKQPEISQSHCIGPMRAAHPDYTTPNRGRGEQLSQEEQAAVVLQRYYRAFRSHKQFAQDTKALEERAHNPNSASMMHPVVSSFTGISDRSPVADRVSPPQILVVNHPMEGDGEESVEGSERVAYGYLHTPVPGQQSIDGGSSTVSLPPIRTAYSSPTRHGATLSAHPSVQTHSNHSDTTMTRRIRTRNGLAPNSKLHPSSPLANSEFAESSNDCCGGTHPGSPVEAGTDGRRMAFKVPEESYLNSTVMLTDDDTCPSPNGGSSKGRWLAMDGASSTATGSPLLLPGVGSEKQLHNAPYHTKSGPWNNNRDPASGNSPHLDALQPPGLGTACPLCHKTTVPIKHVRVTPYGSTRYVYAKGEYTMAGVE